MKDTATATATGATRYRAIVVDLVPGVSADQRASECTSEARANTIQQAEREAIAASAENCDRRVYVVDDADLLDRPVKGPYILRAKADTHHEFTPHPKYPLACAACGKQIENWRHAKEAQPD